MDRTTFFISLLSLMLPLAALMTLRTRHNFKLILYFTAFSFTAATLYLLHQAPDISLAEIAVGCAFIPLIYTIAIMKQNILNVVVKATMNGDTAIDQEKLSAFMARLGEFGKSYGLEPKLIGGEKGRISTVAGIFRPGSADLLLEYDALTDSIRVEGNESNWMIEALERWLEHEPGVEFVGVIENDNQG
ncbi:MAG: DUF4040 domain-containing protein [Erysipelotrichaceae bacterium]|nr:DUF4040 domain-containing protein [Erysipelotrichaceae bacterium]